MPLHIGELQVSMTTVGGDLPLSDRQLEQIAARVVAMLARRECDAAQRNEATKIRTSARPPTAVER